MSTKKNIYFIADLHLGLPLYEPKVREKKVVDFLNSIKDSASDIYLLGDVFDFWWEYKYVVPRGYVRFLATLAAITEAGVRVRYFIGNHDVWAKDYLEEECGVKVYHEPSEIELEGKRFFLAHGDGLGNGDRVYKFLKWIFHNKFLQKIFGAIHPRWGIGFGYAWSKSSRLSKGIATPFKGKEENLYKFAVEKSTKNPVDYFIFGHRHTPVNIDLPTGAQMIILGDWIANPSYAIFDGKQLELKSIQ